MISINALRACDYYSHSATQRGLLIWLSLLAIFNALSWVLPIVSRVSRQNTKKLEAGYGNGSWRLRGAQSISSAVFIQFSTQLSHDRYTFYFVLAQILFLHGTSVLWILYCYAAFYLQFSVVCTLIDNRWNFHKCEWVEKLV